MVIQLVFAVLATYIVHMLLVNFVVEGTITQRTVTRAMIAWCLLVAFFFWHMYGR